MNKHICDNCQGVYATDEIKPVKDLEQRIEPGCMVPSGECPKCGALCYPKDAVVPAVYIRVHGGMVQGVLATTPDIAIEICDTDILDGGVEDAEVIAETKRMDEELDRKRESGELYGIY